MDPKSLRKAPANDAQLIQLVRTRLGREGVKARINVSSCGHVVTLHGMVQSKDQGLHLEAVVRRVAGVEGVINKLSARQTI